MYGGPSAASETDGETFDDHTEYDDYDGLWEYQEMFTNLLVVLSARLRKLDSQAMTNSSNRFEMA